MSERRSELDINKDARRSTRSVASARALHGLAVGMRRIRLEEFEEPYGMPERERSAYRRRFITLFAEDESARRGGLGMVTRVTNALGEQYALKVLLLPERADGEEDGSYDARLTTARAAFRAEYESHRAVSGFKGFPRLYGYALVDGCPAMVMEWVEGVTLAQARGLLAVDDEGRLAPLTAARLGRDLFDLLVRLELVGDSFVHRDISPANIMLRTAHLSPAEQDAEGAFDLCLIDFGSSVNIDPAASTSFTAKYATMRCATLGYAPPEMLTGDLPNMTRLRTSQKIDVYAAASVLYELVSGALPFDVGAPRESSPFRIKTDEQPRPLVSAHMTHPDMASLLVREPEVAIAAGRASLDLSLGPDSAELRDALSLVDAQLFDLVLACLRPRQDERPTAEAMRDGLAAFCNHYARNAERALRGERLLPCTGEASWFDTASPYAVNRLVSAVGNAVSLAILLGCVVATSVLLDGVPVTWRLGALAWRTEFSAITAGPVPAMAGPGAGADAMASTVPAMAGADADAMASTGPDAMAGASPDAMAGADAGAMTGSDADAMTGPGVVSTASYDVDDATACPTEALGMIDVTPPVTHNVTVDETGMKTGITTKRDADGEVLDAADDHE